MAEINTAPHKLIDELPDRPAKWNAKRPLVMFGIVKVLKPEYDAMSDQELFKLFTEGLKHEDTLEDASKMLEWDGYANSYHDLWERDKYVWMDFVPGTEMTLELMDWERGRSAVTYWWRDVKTGIRYPMFGKDMYETVRECKIVEGRVTAGWHAVKRGANYGVSAVPTKGQKK